MRYIQYFMIAYIALGCDINDDPFDSSQYISGTIVGNKCSVYALQLDKNATLIRSLGAEKWMNKDHTKNPSEITEYENVIGLLDLPAEYKKVGKRLFLHIRAASKEERVVACTHDMPNPPMTRYIVLKVSPIRHPK